MNALDVIRQEKLDALRRRLVERLPSLVADLEAACRDALLDEARREPALRGSHTLAGTAGTYGFRDLGRAAAALEDLFRAGTPKAEEVEAALLRLRELLP